MCFCTHAVAQENILSTPVNVSLDSANIQTFVETIEHQTNCFFYYDDLKFDSFYVKMHVTDMPLQQVLDLAFKNTGIYYSVDERKSIFLTVNTTIALALGEQPPAVIVKSKYLHNKSNAASAANSRSNVVSPARVNFEENKIYDIGFKANEFGTGAATVAGYVRHNKTGEGVSGASIYVEGYRARAITDQYGYYTLTLPKGKHILRITCIGLTDTRRQINLYTEGKLIIHMTDYITSLKEVNIAGEKTSNVKSTVVGFNKVNIKTVKQLPTLLGEADIVRVLLNLPGVTSVGEGSTGLNVRGGAVDQNLVLFDGATIFNPSHFFGFFSGFNPDVVKDAELYKSSLPVKYGSRLSSVLEVSTREGNQNKFSGSGGVGPLSGHLTFEGPIGKNTSFIIGGRSTYSDWTLNLLEDEKYKNSSASFYDVNARITHTINDRNTIYVSGYMSGDKFRLDGDTLYQYGNKNAVVKWKHNFNNRLTSIFTAGYDRYDFQMESEQQDVTDFKFKFDIMQYHGKLDFTYVPNTVHRFETGLGAIYYKSHPGTISSVGKGSVVPDKMDSEQALDLAAYVADNITITPDLTLNVGVRANYYGYFGPRTVYEYAPGVPRDVRSITDTINKTGNIKNYIGLEPRVSLRYTLPDNNSSIKVAYNRTRQNIHMLSNTTAISPVDTWKFSDDYIQPQVGDQVAVGYYKNFKDNTIETSVEAYYKWIKHTLTYKSGAELFLNPHIETDVANATGKAYGVELLVKKTAGKLTGWVSYTYSRTFVKMDDPLVLSPINGGDYFPADYDKPHVVNFISNYKFSHRFSVSLTANYSTGRPITVPIGRYYYGGAYRMYYADRNTERIPDYFRTDLSMNIEGNHKTNKLFHSSFTVGVYNLTARRNPYSVYFVTENGKVNGYKLSIFGSAIPFATYNFKF